MTKKKADRMYLLFYIIVGFLCAGLLLARFFLHPVNVAGSSMSPTYTDGEILSTIPFDPEKDTLQINDIIVFVQGNFDKHLIKRVVALEKDTVQVIDGFLYVNDKLVDDGFDRIESAGCIASKYTVPENCVFVLGDNRNHSSDSREFGAISLDTVTSVVDKILIGNN